MFYHSYTKIEFLTEKLNVSSQTASKYLNQLCDLGILKVEKLHKSNDYINIKLFALFETLPEINSYL